MGILQHLGNVPGGSERVKINPVDFAVIGGSKIELDQGTCILRGQEI